MTKWQRELDQLDIPKNVHERAIAGVKQVRKKRRAVWMQIVAVIVVLCVVIVAIKFLNEQSVESPAKQVTTEGNGMIHVPAMQIPDDASTVDMIGLVVYNGHIYTQSDVTYTGPLRALQGEKLGTTKNLMDEWSSASAYEKQFASNIGKKSIYRVKGYDIDFRLMFYSELEGKKRAEIFERLNDLTIATGADVFKHFRLKDNIVSATWQNHVEWNETSKTVHLVKDVAAMERFASALYSATPHSRNDNEPLAMEHNNSTFKALTIKLKDGTAMTFKLLKGGYVYYGFTDVYFEIDKKTFNDIWNLLQ